ncbi:MAG TPA: efflux RND transporter periplasmic adaptor subunit, partial [Thermoanaerobaculia bacterium]|nr:efflux RND transporter periplasmic adaptor subunit [Thermoanaerobaculia bacterium]
RYIIPQVIAVFFFGAGLSLLNKLSADRQCEWVHPTLGDLVSGVDVTGTLASVESDSFGPPQLPDVWDFKISMMAPEGADVKRGAPVLGFDTTELQRRLDEKTAESDQALKEIEKRRSDLTLRTKDERLKLAESEAKLRKTQLKLEAPPDIMKINERKQIELDYALAKRELAAGRARIHALESAATAEIQLLSTKQRQAATIVAQTQDAIRQMTVLAPRDGTIVYVTNWRGDKKKVGDTCWKRERVIEIPNLNKMMAKGEVDEVDAGRVAVGQRVSFRLDAHPDEVFRGTISSAAQTVQQKQGSNDPLKIMRVDVALDRTDPAKMRPGMRFKGTVELSRTRDLLLVPKSAVAVTDKGPVVYRRGLFSVATVPVKIGGQSEEFVQVVDGLDTGDRVLVSKGETSDETRR